jgi:membrane protease subunit (stomatin/prohibitin family)
MAIIEVIKYEGDNTAFIWKHPAEDFNTSSQLIVNESQEAIFFRDGQALDTFGPGRHTLKTENIPFLRKIINLPTGDVSAFHCQVYFINKTVQMSLPWGTDTRVRFIDPLTGVPLEIGASGEMNLAVSNSRKLLTKLVGTTSGIAWGDRTSFTKSLQDSFWPLVSSSIKAQLSVSIKARSIDLLEVDSHLTELSEELCARILPGFEEYGLTIPQFYVTNVSLPEDDSNFKRIRDVHTAEFQKHVAKVEAEVRQAQAYAQRDLEVTEAQVAAEVTAAQREVVLEQQTTETEVRKREAERQVIDARADADVLRTVGAAEAEVMRAQGYTKQDLLNAEVQKAYAQGLGNMGSNGGGSDSLFGDILGLGVGLSAASALMPQMGGMFQGQGQSQGQPTEPQSTDPNAKADNTVSNHGAATETTVQARCSSCGASLPKGAKFCYECGQRVEMATRDKIICPSCGNPTPAGKFCIECGSPLERRCPSCGTALPLRGSFCPECGQRL